MMLRPLLLGVLGQSGMQEPAGNVTVIRDCMMSYASGNWKMLCLKMEGRKGILHGQMELVVRTTGKKETE